jgi:hypothetical protein
MQKRSELEPEPKFLKSWSSATLIRIRTFLLDPDPDVVKDSKWTNLPTREESIKIKEQKQF